MNKCVIFCPPLILLFLVPEESPVDMDTITLDPDEEVIHNECEVLRWKMVITSIIY